MESNMGDHTPRGAQDPATPTPGHGRHQTQTLPSTEEIFRYLAQHQGMLTEAVGTLSQAVHTYIDRQTQGIGNSNGSRTTIGPRPREPKSYDGDRSNGKLDDHIRDITNWIAFYAARGYWTDETEQVTQVSQFLTGKIHRLFSLQQDSIFTMPEYIEWLRNTFQDRNEQAKLRDEWDETVQGRNSVNEYANKLILLKSQLTDPISETEIKRHFLTGLNDRLKIKTIEHPEWQTLPFRDLIARVDRQEQIEIAKSAARRRMDGHYDSYPPPTSTSSSTAYAITTAPRRGARTLSRTRSPRPTSRSRSRERGTPRKGSPEWIQYCFDHELCLWCGKTDHRRSDCPTAPPSDPTRVRATRRDSPYPRGRSRSRDGSTNPTRDRSRSSSKDRGQAQKNVAFTGPKALA